MNFRTLSIMIALAVSTSAAFAQDITIGELLKLEDQIKLKELNEKLTKPNPNAPPPAPAPISLPSPAAVAKSHPTQTLAVYGTAPAYEAQLTMGGSVYNVRVGSRVGEYTVSAVNQAGVELSKAEAPKKSGKKGKGAGSPTQVTLFAPLVSN